MTPTDAEEYTQALGQVVAGSWRQVALGSRLGVPQALGLTLEEWVQDRLHGYVRLSVQERREAVKELTAPIENGGGGLSTRAAADVLGVDNKTVWRDQEAVANATGATTTDVADEDEAVANATPEPAPARGPASRGAEDTFLNGLMAFNKLTYTVDRAGGIEAFSAGWDRARRDRYAKEFAELRAMLARWEAACAKEESTQ